MSLSPIFELEDSGFAVSWLLCFHDALSISLSLSIYIYIYAYIHIHIQRESERERSTCNMRSLVSPLPAHRDSTTRSKFITSTRRRCLSPTATSRPMRRTSRCASHHPFDSVCSSRIAYEKRAVPSRSRQIRRLYL